MYRHIYIAFTSILICFFISYGLAPFVNKLGEKFKLPANLPLSILSFFAGVRYLPTLVDKK